MVVLRLVLAALCFAALPFAPLSAKQAEVAYYPLLKANYTYSIPTSDGMLTVAMSVPSVLPVDIDDGHSALMQPVFVTFTLSPKTSRAALELDLPHRAADPVASRFRDPYAARFIEAFARSVMSVSACHGGEIGVQSAAGRYRREVAQREAERARKSDLPIPSWDAGSRSLPIRMETRGTRFIVWKADMTCSFWRNPSAQKQLARLHEGLAARTRDPLAKIRGHRLWETANNHSFGRLPSQPAKRPGPRWGDPTSAGLYISRLPGIARAPGILRANPRAPGKLRASPRTVR